jgi:hypothetical protein
MKTKKTTMAVLNDWDGKFESRAMFSYEIEAKFDGERITIAGKSRGWNRDLKSRQSWEIHEIETGFSMSIPGTKKLDSIVELSTNKIASEIVSDSRFPISPLKIAEFKKELRAAMAEHGQNQWSAI